MSKKRMMSKQQRLYYEYKSKDRIRQELLEIYKDIKDLEERLTQPTTHNPHQNSYYN